jgi:hypothetical protein
VLTRGVRREKDKRENERDKRAEKEIRFMLAFMPSVPIHETANRGNLKAHKISLQMKF